MEALTGVGARGLRVANELKVEKIIINDLNPTALKIAKESASLNNLKSIEFSEKEACVFLNEHSRKGNRGSLVDIDPFWFTCSIFLIVELEQPCTEGFYQQQQQIFKF